MSLFQCEVCGCCENTALSSQGCCGAFEKLFDWSYAPERQGKRLCSACAPVSYSDGSPTRYGEWHQVFPRVFLPKGMFFTNKVGNLEHKETGSVNFSQYALEKPQ